MPAKPTASKPKRSPHAVFSFFSGAGFLDLGFEKSGFEIAFANELNVEFVEGSCTLEQLDAQPSALD